MGNHSRYFYGCHGVLWIPAVTIMGTLGLSTSLPDGAVAIAAEVTDAQVISHEQEEVGAGRRLIQAGNQWCHTLEHTQ